MQLRRIKFEIYSVLLVISLGILVHSVSEAEINLTTSGLRVADVTPTAFSLVWVANQAATCFAYVYSDPEGADLINGLMITDESASHPPAADNGVMKVRVSGLTKNTTYYFRIVTTSNEGVLIEPASDALPSVRTEDRTVVGYNNGVLAHKVLKGDGTTHAESALVLAEIQGGSYPITAWVGVSSDLPEWAFLELDNFYDPGSHRSLELMGGEPVTLTSIGGSIGFRRLSGWLPQQLGGLPFTLDPEPEYPDDCILDLAGPVIDTQQIQPDSGAFINDNTPFITAAYTDHYSDIDLASVKLLVDSVDVTDQATVDSQKVEYAPTSPLSEGSHDVALFVADEWGYEADPFSWTFNVDITPPVITITSPTHGDFLFPPSQTVRWSINEENLAGITCTMNGNSDTLTPDVSEHPLALEPGANVIEVAAMDQAGNSTSESIQVMLDDDFDLDGIGDHSDADGDNDRLPDIWEEANELNPYYPIDSRLDSDGDGHSNLTEYSADTDPQDPGSYPLVTLAADYITVTDVTPEGFSVAWQATEPSTCSLEVFDESGAFLGNLDLESESAIHPPAEDNGVMKVRVSGLAANTVYRFQTLTVAKASGLALLSPAYPEVVEVVTEAANSTVSNDPIKQRIYDEDDMDAEGTLLVVTVAGGDFPISSWVGEDIASPWARVDLNRIYSSVTHENFQLLGDEELRLWSFGGLLGNYLNIQKVPAQSGEEHPALPEVARLSSELGYHLDFNVNLNITGLPVYNVEDPFTAHSLLLHLQAQAGGEEIIVSSIRRRNPLSGSWETASWFMGQPAGEDFPIKPGESYLVYMKQTLSQVWFEGIATGSAVDLGYGLNLVCLPSAKDDFTYTSYNVLQDLGNADEVASIKRYTPTGGWDTTSWFEGLPSGDLYVTTNGEGYLIYMKQGKADWRAY